MVNGKRLPPQVSTEMQEYNNRLVDFIIERAGPSYAGNEQVVAESLGVQYTGVFENKVEV